MLNLQRTIIFPYPDINGNCFIHRVPNCAKYNLTDTRKCLECTEFYTLNSTWNMCVSKCTYPCLNCQNNNCTLCISGFYANSSGQCAPCGYGCK